MTFYELLKNIINKLGLTVRTDVQTLSDKQKAQVRENIGAVSENISVNGQSLSSDVILTADDVGVYVQSEEPVDAVEGDIWVDVDADSHLDPEIVIDSTLTQSGQAADAKVVGSKLSELGVYVTPQMFGAVADGVTDDSAAIQAAIDSNETVFFPKGVYLINNTINLTNKERYNIYAENAKIVYSGSNYAFELENCSQCNLHFGNIAASNGGCVYFNGTNKPSIYINLYFNNFYSNTNCIYTYVANNAYINEIRVFNGWFSGGENGIRLDNNNAGHISGWRINNCGVEGVNVGIYANAIQGSIRALYIDNFRYGENFDILLKTTGTVLHSQIFGAHLLYEHYFDLSDDTREFYIHAPTAESGGWVWAYDAVIMDGLLLPQMRETKYLNGSFAVDENGVIDLREKANMGDIIGFMLTGPQSKELYLSNRYGRKYGINKFDMYYQKDTNNEFAVYDFNGNVIFNNVASLGWCILHFEWCEQYGWTVTSSPKIKNVV